MYTATQFQTWLNGTFHMPDILLWVAFILILTEAIFITAVNKNKKQRKESWSIYVLGWKSGSFALAIFFSFISIWIIMLFLFIVNNIAIVTTILAACFLIVVYVWLNYNYAKAFAKQETEQDAYEKAERERISKKRAFRIGEKVRVKNNLKLNKRYKYNIIGSNTENRVSEEKMKYLGQVVTIKNYDDYNQRIDIEEENECSWSEGMFEKIEPIKKSRAKPKRRRIKR